MNFSAKPLKVLDKIYRFVGGQLGPTEFSLEAAIQPVHDVSRESEIGSGLGSQLGYMVRGTVDVHSGAGAINTTFDPYEIVDTFSPDRSQYGVWLIDAWCHANGSTNYLVSSVSVLRSPVPNIVPVATHQITHFFPDAITSTVVGVVSIGDNSRLNQQCQLPLFLADGSVVQQHTQAQIGAITITEMILFWVGAQGAIPPGLA